MSLPAWCSGGTSIFGGRGTIIGTVLGLILIQALKNGLSLSGVKGDGTIVVIGWFDRRDPCGRALRQEQRRLNSGGACRITRLWVRKQQRRSLRHERN
jgi:hypothetical protein